MMIEIITNDLIHSYKFYLAKYLMQEGVFFVYYFTIIFPMISNNAWCRFASKEFSLKFYLDIIVCTMHMHIF